MLANVVLHSVANKWLCRQFDSCKLADALMNEVLTWILIVDKALGKALGSLSWSGWNVGHLLHLQVFEELRPRK